MSKKQQNLALLGVGLLFVIAFLAILLPPKPPETEPAKALPQESTLEQGPFLSLPDKDDDEDLHSLTGFRWLDPEQADPEILSALQTETGTVLRHAEIPEAPESVWEYRGEVMEFDGDAVIQTILGTDSQYTLEPDASGYHFYARCREGEFNGVYDPRFRVGILRAQRTSEAGGFDEAAASDLVASLNRLLAFPPDLECSETWTQAQTGERVLVYEQRLDGIPLSASDWAEVDRDVRATGSSIVIGYQNGNFENVDFVRPFHAERTGNTIPISVSPEEALELFEQTVTQAPGAFVFDVQRIALVYLVPEQESGTLLLAWKISYDFYSYNRDRTKVDANMNDYCCLVDASSKKLLRVH